MMVFGVSTALDMFSDQEGIAAEKRIEADNPRGKADVRGTGVSAGEDLSYKSTLSAGVETVRNALNQTSQR